MRSLLDLQRHSVKEIMKILEDALHFEDKSLQMFFPDKIAANLFFESSTRTHYSFMVAEHRLGIKVLDFATASSSMNKGESFYDTVKTFASLGVDVLVIRDSQNAYYEQLASIDVPILNAGDGTGNHPTQSLLDLLTIYQEFGRFDGLSIAIAGDVVHSRVAGTNMEVMKRLGMQVYTCGPKEYAVVDSHHITMEEAVNFADIIMLLRVQKERHKVHMDMPDADYLASYGLDMEKVNKMRPHAIILHPAPFNRNVEIADEVVECSRSRIFKQMENGVYVRMAVLKRALEGK